MTFEQCEAVLAEIRKRQGTDRPLVQVTCSGAVLRGRVTRTDSDRPARSRQQSPYGLLVLEQPGLVPGPHTFVQIASIPENGVADLRVHEEVPASKRLVASRN
ncbi:MAG: hypothetical protein ACLP7Q_05800 [Isosphaeraceae bacterium]